MSACTVTPINSGRAQFSSVEFGSSTAARVPRSTTYPRAAFAPSASRTLAHQTPGVRRRPHLTVIEGGLSTSVEAALQPPLSAASTETKVPPAQAPKVITKGVRRVLAIVASLVIVAGGALTGAIVGDGSDAPAVGTGTPVSSSAGVTP